MTEYKYDKGCEKVIYVVIYIFCSLIYVTKEKQNPHIRLITVILTTAAISVLYLYTTLSHISRRAINFLEI